jgi:hypothetical protein
VERQHGSSKKAWPKGRGQKGRRNTQAKQSRPQRIGAEGRAHACKKKGGSWRIGAQGRTQAPLARIESNQKKAGDLAGFFS